MVQDKENIAQLVTSQMPSGHGRKGGKHPPHKKWWIPFHILQDNRSDSDDANETVAMDSDEVHPVTFISQQSFCQSPTFRPSGSVHLWLIHLWLQILIHLWL